MPLQSDRKDKASVTQIYIPGEETCSVSSPVFPEITRGREKGNLFNVEEQEVVAQLSEPEGQNDSKWK